MSIYSTNVINFILFSVLDYSTQLPTLHPRTFYIWNIEVLQWHSFNVIPLRRYTTCVGHTSKNEGCLSIVYIQIEPDFVINIYLCIIAMLKA